MAKRIFKGDPVRSPGWETLGRDPWTCGFLVHGKIYDVTVTAGDDGKFTVTVYERKRIFKKARFRKKYGCWMEFEEEWT